MVRAEEDGADKLSPESIKTFLEHLPEIRKLLDRADAALKNAWADFKMNIARANSPELSALKQQKEALDQFRAENKIRRAPLFPHSRPLHYGIVAVLVLLETALNGLMLARGLETGLIGGWGVALGISILNVVLLGFRLGGASLRLLNDCHVWRRIVALGALAAIFATIYCSNLIVAHYRDALAADPDTAGTVALAAWLANPAIPFRSTRFSHSGY